MHTGGLNLYVGSSKTFAEGLQQACALWKQTFSKEAPVKERLTRLEGKIDHLIARQGRLGYPKEHIVGKCRDAGEQQGVSTGGQTASSKSQDVGCRKQNSRGTVSGGEACDRWSIRGEATAQRRRGSNGA